MGYQTWIADALRDHGLIVEEYAGWTTRGSSSLDPGGVVAHWTAGPCGATGRPSLNTCVNGREGLSGPLCNVYHDRDGICVVVAAGTAQHAGEGGYNGLSGNHSVLGVESEACGPGDRTAAQTQTYPILLAALAAGIGRDQTWTFRHCDWTARKIDINDWPLDDLQTQVGAALGGGQTPTHGWEPPEMIVGQDQQDGRFFSIAGNTRVELPNLQYAQLAMGMAGQPALIALNHDLIARFYPDVFTLVAADDGK